METTDNKQLPENELRQQPTEEKDHDLSEKKDISEKENPQPKPEKKKKTAKDHAIRFFVKIGITALVLILTLKVHHYGLNVRNLITVTVSSVLMFAAVVFIVRMIQPALPGMILGIITGIVVYIGINVLLHNTFLVNDLLRRIKGVMKDEGAEKKA